MFITMIAALAALTQQDPQKVAALDSQDAAQHAAYTRAMAALENMRDETGSSGGLAYYNTGLIPIHDLSVESVSEGGKIRFEGSFYLGADIPTGTTWPPAPTDPYYPKFYVLKGPNFEPADDATRDLKWIQVEFASLTYMNSMKKPPDTEAEGAMVTFKTNDVVPGTTIDARGVAAVLMYGRNLYNKGKDAIYQHSIAAEDYAPKSGASQALRLHRRESRPRSFANNIIPITWMRPVRAPWVSAKRQEWVYANTLKDWSHRPTLYYLPSGNSPVLGSNWVEIEYTWTDYTGHPDTLDFECDAGYVLILAHGQTHIRNLSPFQWSGFIREVK